MVLEFAKNLKHVPARRIVMARRPVSSVICLSLHRFSILCLLIPCLFLLGCWSKSHGPEKGETEQTETESGQLNLETTAVPSSETAVPHAQMPHAPTMIEILWQVPTTAVEAYHIYISQGDDKEERHIKVPVQGLQKIDHPTYGPVYRYELRDVGKAENIKILLRAENQYGLSEPSAPVMVPSQ